MEKDNTPSCISKQPLQRTEISIKKGLSSIFGYVSPRLTLIKLKALT